MMRWAPAALAALLFAVAPAESQVGRPTPTPAPGRRPVPTRPDTVRGRADSVAARDTIARANFAPPDSVMLRLLNTPGYTVTQYQGEQISFDAVTRAVQLTKRAVVQRDSQLVKSDTISYSGQGSAVRVGTDSTGRSVFAAPGQAPIISRGPGTYDIANRRASVRDIRTSIPQSGEVLQITGDRVVVVASATPRDSVRTANDATYYLRDGTITACDDSVPDYYFKAKEIKRTGSFVVARPAVLYIGDVPVMWLPFLFQDIRGGRHSGILSPNFGVSDIVRNCPSYRRQIEGLGYYWAISDFLDAQASFDWRSSAGQVDLNDISFTRYNGELRYRWLERYVTGNLATAYTIQGEQRNTAISWGHSQDFTRNSSLRMDLNYVSNTTLHRSTLVNPYAVLSTIRSSATYTQKLGPANFTLGGSRTQQPGRTQADMTFPSFSMNTSPLNLGSWLTWTPSVSYTSHRITGIDQPSPLGTLLRLGRTPAGIDSIFGDTLRRNSYDSNLSFDTPLTIFGYNIGNRITVTSHRNDFPESAIVTNVTTGQAVERIFTTTYGTQVNWEPSFTLPPLARNNFNLSAGVSLANVDGSAYWIRNERTGGAWVHQSKRLSFNFGASPTLFGLFGGFGPFTRIRHSISPSLTYSYAPQADVSDEYLAALGRSRVGYLGALRQNSLTFGLSTNVEAKTRSRNDSNPEAGDKLKLLSVNFSPLSYDIERARATHQAIRGLTTQSFDYTVRSDLLPGFDLGVRYSLFAGATVSDSARFAPFREGITASFSFSNTANPFAIFQRLFGRAVPPTEASTDQLQRPADDRYARQVASQPVAGRSSRNAGFLPTVTKGWQASFQFSSTRQRPPTGSTANVVPFDAAARCTAFNTPELRRLGVYDQCLARESTNPTTEVPVTSGLVGSPIYLVPNVTTLGGNLNFNVTEHWAASWQTTYDFEHRNFASQVVSLQRDLHDWRAIFAFTQASTGSFAFNFLISLKAEPDLKFDYHKSTYKNEGF
ncbi:MAG: LPS-assembly protein LptD [Gemmatimonadaceae bacterium]|nr:LPS-assembly protein LptD [Gemmatimonadaceae bacterium]